MSSSLIERPQPVWPLPLPPIGFSDHGHLSFIAFHICWHLVTVRLKCGVYPGYSSGNRDTAEPFKFCTCFYCVNKPEALRQEKFAKNDHWKPKSLFFWSWTRRTWLEHSCEILAKVESVCGWLEIGKSSVLEDCQTRVWVVLINAETVS